MMERYRTYILAHPVQGWLVAVLVGLALSRVFGWMDHDSGSHGPPFFNVLVCVAFTSPTTILMMRLSGQGRSERPITSEQEWGIATLALVAGVCAIGVLAVGMVGRWTGWPLEARVECFATSMVAAAVAVALGYGTRSTRLGRGAVQLSAAWGVLLAVDIVGSLIWRAAGHA